MARNGPEGIPGHRPLGIHGGARLSCLGFLGCSKVQGFSFGFPMDARIQGIVDAIPEDCWHPALQTDGEFRDGAWVAEAAGMIDLSSWPDGSRLILPKERPHPGA